MLRSVAVVIILFLGISAGHADASLTWYATQGGFESIMAGNGNIWTATETFEEGTVAPGDWFQFNTPLQHGVAAGPYPTGITALNLKVQANSLAGNPTVPSPGMLGALNGYDGSVSDVVVADQYNHSFDMIFNGNSTHGVGFNVVSLYSHSSSGTVQIRVYDTNNVLVGSSNSPANSPGTNFVGIWSDDPIGRINIWDPVTSPAGFGYEGADNIQMWTTPEPGTLSLMAVGIFALTVRRRPQR